MTKEEVYDQIYKSLGYSVKDKKTTDDIIPMMIFLYIAGAFVLVALIVLAFGGGWQPVVSLIVIGAIIFVVDLIVYFVYERKWKKKDDLTLGKEEYPKALARAMSAESLSLLSRDELAIYYLFDLVNVTVNNIEEKDEEEWYTSNRMRHTRTVHRIYYSLTLNYETRPTMDLTSSNQMLIEYLLAFADDNQGLQEIESDDEYDNYYDNEYEEDDEL